MLFYKDNFAQNKQVNEWIKVLSLRTQSEPSALLFGHDFGEKFTFKCPFNDNRDNFSTEVTFSFALTSGCIILGWGSSPNEQPMAHLEASVVSSKVKKWPDLQLIPLILVSWPGPNWAMVGNNE